VSLRVVRFAAAAVALAGVGVTAYLLSVRWGGAELVCRTGGCDTVQASDYAELFGVPVAALGLGTYVAIAVLVLLGSPLTLAAAASLALAGAAFSAYLLVVQMVVIGVLCDWCLVNDAVITVVAVLVLLGVRASAASPRRAAAA
jgi:uncharacterized membrane protein